MSGATASWTLVDLGNGAQRPSKRSAHVMCNRYPGSVASPRALLVHGGELEGGATSSDTWLCDLDDLASGRSPWRILESTGTPRSNHAAVVVESRLYVFGGVRARREALAHIEILDLDTLQWEVPDARAAPPPRWNPTIVATEGVTRSSLVVFGGYDGSKQFDDVACFLIDSQEWVSPHISEGPRPPPMTDHAAAVVDGTMVVVGGTHTVVSRTGVYEPDKSAHVWTLDLGCLPSHEIWARLVCAGEAPPACTSHTASAVGSLVLVAGGQHSWQMAPLQCHVFDLAARAWSRFGGAEPALQICRHAAVFADGFLVLFGGHDGEALSNDLRRIPLSPMLRSSEAAPGTAAASVEPAEGPKVSSVEMFKVAQKPLTLDDLPVELVEGKSARQLIGVLHRAALARELDMYVDPLSGYPAFTAHYLRRRDCCGNRCRHCPWGHKNVVKTDRGAGAGAVAANIDW